MMLATKETIIEEWRKQDPYLLEPEKMLEFIDKRLAAQELVRLMRLCHPNEHGEAVTRGEVMHRIREQGLKVLDDLGWPRDMNSYYKNMHTGDISTLEQTLWDLTDNLDAWRTKMHEQEETINELTNTDFYCLKPEAETEEKKVRCAGRGLECCSSKDMKAYVNQYPHIKDIVIESLRLHKAFYEQMNAGRFKELKLLTDNIFRNDECIHNIVVMCRMFKIDVDKIEDTSTFPPRSIEGHVWWVVENWEPATPEEVKAWQEKHPEEENDEYN